MEAAIALTPEKGMAGIRRRLLKTKNKALTLIEAAMVLGLFAFIVGAAMYYYGQSNTNRQVTNALGDLASVQQAVRSLYGGQASFNGINNAALTDTTALPKKMVAASGSIRASFGGAVTVASADGGGGADSGFSILFAAVPKEVCAKMSTQDLGRGLYSIAAGSTTKTSTNTANPPPFTPAEAAAACSASNNNITWIFN